MFGAAEVDVTSGVLYGAWCSISAAVIGVLAQQCVCATTIGAATAVGVTCASNGASNRAWLIVGASNFTVARHTVRCSQMYAE